MFSDRYREISVHGEIPEKCIHQLYIMRHPCNIINFLIIEKENRKKAVYFGWQRTETENPPLFKSENPGVISMFENQFSILMRYRTWSGSRKPYLVDYAAEPEERLSANQIVDKVGRWLTVSSSSDIFQNVDTLGLIEIKIVKGKLAISVKVFSSDENPNRAIGEIIEERIHDQDHEIAHKGEKVYFEYVEMDQQQRGFCMYRIYENNLRRPVLNGFLVDSRNSIRNEIRGIKVKTEEQDGLWNGLADLGSCSSEFPDLCKPVVEMIRNEKY